MPGEITVVTVTVPHTSRIRNGEKASCSVRYTHYPQDGPYLAYQKDTSKGSIFVMLHTGSGAHPSPYPMGIWALSQGIKRPGREVDHSPPSSAEVKNAWSYTSILPQYVFMPWCSVKITVD
jgi:hypothetical protein